MAEFNVPNRTILHGDNLKFLRGINSNSVDLVYLDPPFNKKRRFIATFGSEAEGASFEDIFLSTDMKDEIVDNLKRISVANETLCDWLVSVKHLCKERQDQNYNYLVWMAVRLLECRRVLKDSGSLFLHCDDTMSHWLKITLDFIFGKNRFRNEITWNRTWGGYASRRFPRNTDILFWYTKGAKFKFHPCYTPYTNEFEEINYRYIDEATGRRYASGNLRDPHQNPKSKCHYTFRGHTLTWRLTEKNMKRLEAEGGIHQGRPTSVPRRKVWMDEAKGVQVSNIWTDIKCLSSHDKERTGYPTQKPKKLLTRIIEATTDRKDVVLDPFCGCATACEAADNCGRDWVGIDACKEAHELILKRLPNVWRDIYYSTKVPKRTDDGRFEGDCGYVYVISFKYEPDRFKVGIAKNVQQRLANYLTSVPDRKAHKVVFKKETPLFREIEKHVHDLFDADHEWVKAPLDQIVGAIKGYQPNPSGSVR